MTEAPHEVELKLRIPDDAARAIVGHPAVAALQRKATRRARLYSVYFDTGDRRLARAGVAVRLRRAGSGWLQTVKGPALPDGGGGLARRVEYEWRVGRASRRPRLDLAKLATTPYRRTIEKAVRSRPLLALFATDFVRTMVPLVFPDRTTALLCLDQGFVEAKGRGRAAIAELELELESGSAARLFELAARLSTDVALAIETRTKADRGHDLVALHHAAPVRAEPIAFSATATVAEALAAMLRSGLRQVEANADGVVDEDDPEWIHQMRVGARRLRLALALTERVLAAGSVAPLVDEVRWLAGVLGEARDLDVLLGQTLPAIAKDTAGDVGAVAALAELAGCARERARTARALARAAIGSVRFTRLQLAAGWLAALPLLGANPRSRAGRLLARPARELAVDVLKRRHRSLVKCGERARNGSADDRHRLRIATKKMRYAVEFFAPVFGDNDVRAFRTAMVGLQEVLGRANDLAMAVPLAAKLGASASPIAALVKGWAAAHTGAVLGALESAWRAARKAKPFWTGA